MASSSSISGSSRASFSSSSSTPQTPVLVPYPDTVDLKAAKGTFHKQLKSLPLYRARRHCKVSFHGTVKIHGTNITIIFDPRNKAPQIQSRNQIISPSRDDGYGSAAWIAGRLGAIQTALATAVPGMPNEVMIAGELAGKGINPKQAATSDLERFYVIFGVRVDGVWLHRTVWQDARFPPACRVFNIYDFKTYEVVVDFSEERTAGGGKRVGELCLEVERGCPVALQLGGVEKGLGEGIVFTEERGPLRDAKGKHLHPLKFKHKGPAFAMVGKIEPSKGNSSLQDKREADPNELAEKAEQFVEYAVTTARLEQGLESLREAIGRGRVGEVDLNEVLRKKSHINELAAWIKKDVRKEELPEMMKLGLDRGAGKAKMEELITRKVKGIFVPSQKH